MQYEISLADRHRFVLSAKDSPDQSFSIREARIDLSSTNLFMAPGRPADTTGAQHALIPLAEESKAAFNQIDQANQHSPLVEALQKYRESRLPELLARVEAPSFEASLDPDRFQDPKSQKRLEKVLKLIVQQIDRELPHYFKVEKDIGTFEWLRSGGRKTDDFPVKLAPIQNFTPPDEGAGARLITDISGRFIEYDVNSETAYVLDGTSPSTANTLEALCNSGTLGSQFAALNRGVMLHLATAPAREATLALKSTEDFAKKILDTKIYPATMSAVRAMLPGTLAVTLLSAPVVTHAIQNTLGIFDMARTAAATALAYITVRSVQLTLKNRAHAIELQEQWKDGDVERAFPEGKNLIAMINTFATSLIDQTLCRSAGNAQTVLAPKPLDSWQRDMPSLLRPDMSTMPLREVSILGTKMRVLNSEAAMQVASISQTDDYSGQELSPEEIQELSAESLTKAIHIERAFETWNMFHAIGLLEEFTARQNVPSEGAVWLDLKETLTNSLNSHTDESGTYPEASACLSTLTGLFKLNRSSWEHISRALASASVLERLHDSARAQQIAQDVFIRHFGK